jgi:hypothetical protein
MARRWPRLLPLLAGLYLPFIAGGLLTDDFAHVVHLSGIDNEARLIDRPDAFGFYRPITQVSMALAPGMHGERPALARALNAALHAAVIAMAFVVARLLLPSLMAAGMATLAFALTPKAPPIAVLWISARGELLMALFSLAAIAAWIVWTRHGGAWWLAVALVAYALGLLSKETATLLPLPLLLTPRPERPAAVRVAAVTGFIALAVLIYTWRSQIGALMPFATDEHYSLAISAALWTRNAINYAGRMIAAPLVLVALLGLARLVMGRRAGASATASDSALANKHRPMPSASISMPFDVVAFAAAFVAVFLAPVLPIQLRSELYLYLPVVGTCLFAGCLAARLCRDIEPRALTVAMALYVLAFAGYQTARSVAIAHDLVFSGKLVAALRESPALAGFAGGVILVPTDADTNRLLGDAIGGYLYLVLPYATGNRQITGTIDDGRRLTPTAGLRLGCDYRAGEVIISPAASTAQSPS